MPAALEALAAFPVSTEGVTLVNVSENVTFKVTDAASGAPLALRLHRPGYHTLAELESERLWTAALDEVGITAPVGLRARDGAYYVEVAIPERGERRLAGLTRWTEGALLVDILGEEPDAAARRGWFFRLGLLLARLHDQAGAWPAPPTFTRHRLDSDGLVGERPFWGPFWDHPTMSADQRQLILATRETIRAALGRIGTDPSGFGLIHADLHPHNVIVSGEDLGAIDFDDSGFGWHLYDIAVALVHRENDPDFAAVRDALLAGYRSQRALGAEAEALLPMFTLIRRLAQIGWVQQRPELAGPGIDHFIETAIPMACERCRAFRAPV